MNVPYREHYNVHGEAKIGYLTKKEANNTILSMYRMRMAEKDSLHYYKCNVCGCYHIGHVLKSNNLYFMANNKNTQQDAVDIVLSTASGIIHAKNHDYDEAFAKAFKLLGKTYAAGKIYEKTMRIITLSKGEAAQVKESLADSVMDCLGYCCLYLTELMREDEK